MSSHAKSYFWVLICLLTVKAAAVIFFILYGPIHLVPDEAQYWLWSQHLDWGYYSKPPGIALVIAAGTSLFGNTELGVRIGAVAISFLTSIVVFMLARQCNLSEKISFWAAIIMAFSPLGMVGSLYATTDWGLILFWILAFLYFVKIKQEDRLVYYFMLGLCIFGGALFKWTMYLVWVPLIAYFVFEKCWRPKGILLAFSLSLLGLLPSLIWNSTHDWVTFRHVWTQSTGGETTSWNGNPLDFLGAQIALLSPVYFFLLCGFGCLLLKRWSDIPFSLRYLGGICLLILLVYFLLSFFQKIQGNWAIYAYPLGIVAISWYAHRLKKGAFWLSMGTIVSLLFFLSTITMTYSQKYGDQASFQIPFKANPFRPNLGWNKLASALKQAGYDPAEHFLASDKYQTSSLASFYSEGQRRAYFLNLFNRRQNQFCFWPTLSEECMGKDGFFIVLEDQSKQPIDKEKLKIYYEEKLSPFFEKVTLKGIYPLFNAYEQAVRWALIFDCINYNGTNTTNSKKF